MKDKTFTLYTEMSLYGYAQASLFCCWGTHSFKNETRNERIGETPSESFIDNGKKASIYELRDCMLGLLSGSRYLTPSY